MSGIRVHSLQSLSILPSIGAMLGTTHSEEVLDRLRQQNGAGVIFGQEGDPYADKYNALCSLVHDQFGEADRTIQVIQEVIMHPNTYRAIESVEDLYAVPECMVEPILMLPAISGLLKDGRIYGYGIKPENLPEEDVFGRLIDNGKVECVDGKMPDTYVWHWKSDDPVITEEELDNVKKTREWVSDFLVKQMEPGGDWIDPTDPENTISKRTEEEEKEEE